VYKGLNSTKQKIKEKFLRNSVAKRIFYLFIVAAFLPALALAVLSYSQVHDLLLEQSRDRMDHTTRTYALAVYERMLLADNSIKQIAFNMKNGVMPSSESFKFLEQTFSSLSIAGPNILPSPIFGKELFWPKINKSEYAFLANDKTVLFVKINLASRPRVLLLKIINIKKQNYYALVAELNPSKLWGHKDSFPYMTNFCALNDNNILLFCSQSGLETEISNFVKKSSLLSSEYQPISSEEGNIISQWQLFLKPMFHTNHWNIFAIQPAFMALIPITNFSRILIGVIVLTLLLVALLSISQIRRTMGPLGKLIKGTRKLANEDFEYRVAVSSQDEFGELAGSFNEMAGRLGRQHNAFKVLSNIDKAILTRRDIDPVINIVIKRIQEMNSAEPAGITILETSEIGKAKALPLTTMKQLP
jgi:HAMP domain-containing protein